MCKVYTAMSEAPASKAPERWGVPMSNSYVRQKLAYKYTLLSEVDSLGWPTAIFMVLGIFILIEFINYLSN
jgi:hypothetical protein